MADGRKNNGGARKGSGRKRKDEEEKAKNLTIKSLVSQFGSEQKAFEFAAKQVVESERNSFSYFKLLVEYAYGKPKESLDVTSGDQPLQDFNLNSLSDKELSILLKAYKRNDNK